MAMRYTVIFTSKARKQKERLPKDMEAAFDLLCAELEAEGPVRPNWPHYGRLRGKKNVHHCHLNKGKPRYVAVWKEHENTLALLEIYYVGTHEKADYRRMD